MTHNQLLITQEKIGYKFNEPQLLMQAFTRSSFSGENPEWEDNEKLEFVGDKVLDFIVVKKLTSLFGTMDKHIARSREAIRSGKKFEESDIVKRTNFVFVYSEGEMTEIKKQIVQTAFLAAAIDRLGFQEYLEMGKGDIKNQVQNEPHVKEDLLESIIGAVAIDSKWNIESIESVIDKLLNLDEYIKSGEFESVDYVTKIHDWHRKEYKKDPEYRFTNNGSAVMFECCLDLKGYDLFEGIGYSKKAAISAAAKRAWLYMEEKRQLSDKVRASIGSFSLEDSVNKLQILKEKKLIKDVIYTFEECPPNGESNGNPIWSCACTVPGIEDADVEYLDQKKAQAKKYAAYEILMILTGRSRIEEAFEAYGTVLDDSSETNKLIKREEF